MGGGRVCEKKPVVKPLANENAIAWADKTQYLTRSFIDKITIKGIVAHGMHAQFQGLLTVEQLRTIFFQRIYTCLHLRIGQQTMIAMESVIRKVEPKDDDRRSKSIE